MHPNIDFFILSMFEVETQKLKKIVKNMFFFCRASWDFQAVKLISFCTGGTSFFNAYTTTMFKLSNVRG